MNEVHFTYRLANLPGRGDSCLNGLNDIPKVDLNPSLLISYFYRDYFVKHRDRYAIRSWVLDSGAYSSMSRDVEIDLDEYIEFAKHWLKTDPQLEEVFALDVIGDAKQSLKNCEKMWEEGIPAIPTYHRGSPESDLKYIAKNFPKIALGGVAKFRQKLPWAIECFRRVYPKPIHGFGFGTEKDCLALPWHSVDASTWSLQPCAFGGWKTYGYLNIRGQTDQNLTVEIEEWLEVERVVNQRWRSEMRKLREPLKQLTDLRQGFLKT